MWEHGYALFLALYAFAALGYLVASIVDAWLPRRMDKGGA